MTNYQNILPAFSQALNKRGYEKLTPVQDAVIDPELNNSDLLVSAQTGSGKTVAFGLAMAPTLLGDQESFAKAKVPLALVIAPTRELALQVKREFEWLYEVSGAVIASCVGGMDIRTEREALKRGAHIVVGTPGRLRDHIERGSFDVSGLRAVVLDEADEMLDMGFRDELQFILESSPKDRRTLLFSATMPKEIMKMAAEYQTDAKRIVTKGEQKQHVDIEYQAFSIAPSDRENAIINLLRYHEAESAIIFCGTRVAVNHLKSRLNNRGFSVVALSGELSQKERSHALQSLRDKRSQICVATDVAARGIDLPGLGLVIHADIPQNQEILLHRSGRTGRAGSKGISALIAPFNARKKVERLLHNANVAANWQRPPSIDEILKRDRERFLENAISAVEVTEKDQELVDELLSRYTPQQIAASLINAHNLKRPAPEELLDANAFDKKEKGRRNSGGKVWISLSTGSNASANPKWIIPMLCEAGKFTKDQIGTIKINKNDTHVELAADVVDAFFKAVGPEGRLEKNVIATRLRDVPSQRFRSSRGRRGNGAGNGDRKKFKPAARGGLKQGPRGGKRGKRK